MIHTNGGSGRKGGGGTVEVHKHEISPRGFLWPALVTSSAPRSLTTQRDICGPALAPIAEAFPGESQREGTIWKSHSAVLPSHLKTTKENKV